MGMKLGVGSENGNEFKSLHGNRKYMNQKRIANQNEKLIPADLHQYKTVGLQC